MEYITRIALPEGRGHTFRILEIGTRQASGSPWSFAYHDYMMSKKVKSNQRAHRDIRKYLEKLARYGKTVFRHPDQFRDVGPTNDVLELKPGAHRLLLFRHDDDWLILDAFKKPSRKVQDQKIQNADAMRIDYLRSLTAPR
jgi:hypothetical protein